MPTPARGASIERDALTSDGLAIHIRPARPDDVEAIDRFHDEELSDTSAYFRFFGARPELSSKVLTEWATADSVENATLLALHDERIVAVGLYRCVDARQADVAFAVADRLQHRGIATLLLEDLCMLARRAGYERLIAETLPGNTAMKAVFRDVGLEVSSVFDHGVTDVAMPLGDGAEMRERADRRDRAATVASLRPILAPQHIVVIGASATHDRPGNTVIRNLRRGFTGRLDVVHPSAPSIEGVDAHRSVADLPSPADLAIIAVPAAAVPEVIEQCGEAGTRSAVILSAGFTETGTAGATLEAEVLRRARRHGMRLVGPNCFGVAVPAIGVDATFGTIPITAGSIAFASQSGGLGIALLGEVARRGLGISSFVSLGNKIDVSSNDLLCFWAADPSTRVIALYLESFGNPRKFARLARSISPERPIVALKGGRSEAGRRGAQSHTAALATDDRIVDALFSHGGIIRAHTIEELIDVASILDRQPLPGGPRVAVVGNAGGPLILAADAAEASRLAVPALSAELQARILALVPDAAATGNPVDLLATVTKAQLASVVELLAASGEVDAIAVVNVPVGRASVEAEPPAPATPSVPVVVATLGADGTGRPDNAFTSPERAIHALSRVAEYADWRRRREHEAAPTTTPVRVETAGALERLRKGRRSAAGWLAPEDAFATLDELGISAPAFRFVHERDEVAAAALAVGFPAVLKADAETALHKAEMGAIALGIRSADEAEAAFDRFAERFGADLRGVLVQHQLPAGLEILVGINRSERFGPLLVIGAGGTMTELIGDREVLMVPATRTEIGEAIQRLRIAPVLRGDLRHPGVDLDSLIDVAHRLGVLVDRCPELVEVDLNPVVASAGGAVAVDVRMRLAEWDDPVIPLRGLRPAPVG